jgi:putative endonuclease
MEHWARHCEERGLRRSNLPLIGPEIASQTALATPALTGRCGVTEDRNRMQMRQSYVYILTNKNNTVLYTGVTSNLKKRVWEHREKLVDGFTKQYNVTRLVYYEVFADIRDAIGREKQLKGGSRQKKIDLINSMNAEWRDLYDDL